MSLFAVFSRVRAGQTKAGGGRPDPPHLDYPQYEKLAEEAGFLRRKRGQLELSADFSNRESVLRFAKLIDKEGKLVKSIGP